MNAFREARRLVQIDLRAVTVVPRRCTEDTALAEAGAVMVPSASGRCGGRRRGPGVASATMRAVHTPAHRHVKPLMEDILSFIVMSVILGISFSLMIAWKVSSHKKRVQCWSVVAGELGLGFVDKGSERARAWDSSTVSG